MKEEQTLNIDKLNDFLASIAQQHPERNQIAFLCIGTDRSTGDSFGPLVGTLLKEQGWQNVSGTMRQPCDAHNVGRAIHEIELQGDTVIIAIDACLGKPSSVGTFITIEGPVKPGQATGVGLPAVGNYSIAGVVNANSPKPYMTLQTTSLYRVMEMARAVAEAVELAWMQNSINDEECMPNEQPVYCTADDKTA